MQAFSAGRNKALQGVGRIVPRMSDKQLGAVEQAHVEQAHAAHCQ